MFATTSHPWAIQDLAFALSVILPVVLIGLVAKTLRCGCAAWELAADDPRRRRRCASGSGS